MPLDRTTAGGYHDSSNARIRKIGSVSGPSSYATGGEAIAPVDLGMGRVELLLFESATNGTDLRLVRYDYATGKVKWFDLAGAEIAAAQNLSAYSARFEAIGK
jgi:hypothetical protein